MLRFCTCSPRAPVSAIRCPVLHPRDKLSLPREHRLLAGFETRESGEAAGLVASLFAPAPLLITDRQHQVRSRAPGLFSLGSETKFPSPLPFSLESDNGFLLWLISGCLPSMVCPWFAPSSASHRSPFLTFSSLNHSSGTVFPARTQTHTVLNICSQKRLQLYSEAEGHDFPLVSHLDSVPKCGE